MATISEQPVLAWIDTETTGLDPSSGLLLQVACILTDARLRVLVDEPFEAVIGHPHVAAIRRSCDTVVRDMHDRTGLWDRAAAHDAPPLHDVEANLLAYIEQAAPTRRQARIAGSSIRHDLNFLDAHMPDVAQHLHYRSVDVSAISFIAEHNLDYTHPTAGPSGHEALADIRASMAQLRDVLEQTTPMLPMLSGKR